MAEFEDPTSLVAATHGAYREGYRVHGRLLAVSDRGAARGARVAAHAAAADRARSAACVGCIGGYALQYWVSAIAYPLNIGGKPLHSWPAFIPVTFECTILVAALSCVLGMLALNGLPQPYHPVFNVPRFALASRNRFFLCIESKDPKFELEATRHFLETLNPREVTTVAD